MAPHLIMFAMTAGGDRKRLLPRDRRAGAEIETK
jgi:hypothetical protein